MALHSMLRAVVVVGGLVLVGGGCAARKAESASAVSAQEEGQKRQMCGGFAGLPCPEPLVCVDDPSDDCDPTKNGRDCSGLCQKEKAPEGNDGPGSRCDNPRRHYVSKDPEKCAVVRFICPPPDDAKNADKTNFFGDDCGCGCEAPAP